MAETTRRAQTPTERIRERAPRVVVVGDLLLDGWWSGTIGRIAREAPAPVVDLNAREHVPGGAANTAVNLAALGARVAAVGLVGDDEAGRILREALVDAGVDVSRVRAITGARTTTKVRVSAGEQVIVRIDDSQPDPWPAPALDALIDDVAAASADADAQVVCDYGSLLGDEVVERLAALPRPALRVVDAHDARRLRALRPELVTPNAAEAELLAGESLGSGELRAERAAELSERIRETAGARAAVVTLDRDGTVLLAPGSAPVRTRAHPYPEKQASGAGDVFVAALTAAHASGEPLESAVALAQRAADVAVQRVGTCVCGLDELERAAGAELAVVDQDLLAARLDEHRARGDRIVFTNGCFDVLHRGHTASLRQAASLGDVLVVAVNSDASVRRLKGEERPVNGERDRADVIAALACVDYVTIFTEDTPRELIRRLRPHVYAKGGDYTPEMLAETAAADEIGAQIAILDYVADHSTTQIIGRIREVASDGARR